MHRALGCDPRRDSFVSWLPLYHDMGLVGKLMNSLLTGTTLVLVPPAFFAWRPMRFMRLVHQHRASFCAMPNFALEWILRMFEKTLDKSPELSEDRQLDLGSLRWLGVGSEPVNARTLRRFTETFAPLGLRPEVVAPCYGLAEATLAVTLCGSAATWRPTTVDACQYVTNGTLVDDVELKIEPSDEAPAGAGRILIRGPSISAHAYVAGRRVNTLDAEGYYDTRDLGFLLDGQLVVLGRADEMMIVNGANYFPYDIEAVARESLGLAGVRAACFAIAGPAPSDPRPDGAAPVGRPRVVLLIEGRGLQPETGDRVAHTVRGEVLSRLGLALDEVLVVPARTIPVTTSGKIRRRAARDVYLELRSAAAA
jgi:acyl-CoA synthetase (AMP-forming)/AMP-acid ligase II